MRHPIQGQARPKPPPRVFSPNSAAGQALAMAVRILEAATGERPTGEVTFIASDPAGTVRIQLTGARAGRSCGGRHG